MGENASDLFAEVNVVNKGSVSSVLNFVVTFETVVLHISELNLLTVKGGSELGRSNGAFSERVVVLEEFKEADAIFFDDVFYFLHQLLELAFAVVVNKFGCVGAFSQSCRAVNFKFKNIAVLQKFGVFYFTSLAAIN